MRFRVLLLALTLMPLVASCMSWTYKVPPYSPNYEFIDGLKGRSVEKIAVGEVQPRDPNSPVNKITHRVIEGEISLSVRDGTFADYLEEAIKYDLREIGILDQGSRIQLNATIIRNDVNLSKFSRGTGVMEVNITIGKDGNVTFDRPYSVQTKFLAGPLEYRHSEYPVLVRTLLEKVYADPEFFNAIKK